MGDAALEPETRKARIWRQVSLCAAMCLLPLSAAAIYIGLALSGVLPLSKGFNPGFLIWIGALATVVFVGDNLLPHRIRLRVRHLVLTSLIVAPAGLGVALAINFKAVKVEGDSMQPTLQPGDVLLVDLTAEPDNRYGIYTLNLPEGDHAHVIKRLVGLPGEAMDVRYGRVFAGELEVYPRDGSTSDDWNETRPANARFYSGPRDNGDGYFVLGDNPPDSRDSRHFGALDESAFEGRVVWSLRGSHGFGAIQ